MTIVVFRKENERLATVCTVKFKNAEDAKKHIEEDAAYVCAKHNAIDVGWIKPNTLDYYMVMLKSGVNCIWQYFTI